MKLGFHLKEWPKTVRERRAYMDPTFAAIASRYDLMTRVLSFGQEKRWKKKAVRLISNSAGAGRILDLASGTGEFLLQMRSAGIAAPIVALDRNAEMIELARTKLKELPAIALIRGDLTQIPLRDGCADVVTLGYGLRYVVDIRETLLEIRRLLRRGGLFVCLDFGIPRSRLYRRVCEAYLLLLGSFLGWMIHGKADTYWHIVESLRAYPGQQTIKAWLAEVGFREVEARDQLGGIIAILSAIRP